MAVTITRTAWVDDDGTGTTGTVINNAAKQEIYDQIDGALAKVPQLVGGNTFTGDLKTTADIYEKNRTTPIGHWITVPYSAGLFSTDTGTWTVDPGDFLRYQYALIGKTMLVSFAVQTTSTSGSPGFLMVAFPSGIVGSLEGSQHQAVWMNDGAWKFCSGVLFGGNETKIRFMLAPAGGVWPTLTNVLALSCMLTFPIA